MSFSKMSRPETSCSVSPVTLDLPSDDCTACLNAIDLVATRPWLSRFNIDLTTDHVELCRVIIFACEEILYAKTLAPDQPMEPVADSRDRLAYFLGQMPEQDLPLCPLLLELFERELLRLEQARASGCWTCFGC